ncbi:retrovirus-related pol polyprotein from transposon RE1 [Citrus sinensis]|nr:retrovirus-related pol polyprotein from transposon RE1 [Citrus sinensis]
MIQLGDVKEVKEAHICSQAEDHRAEDQSSFYNQLQVDDMYCQLAPGGYVAACTHTRDKFVNHLPNTHFLFYNLVSEPVMASLNIASSNHTSNIHTNSTNFSFTFNTPVKLDQANYLIWRSQVLASIRGNKLEKFIDENVTPPPSHIAQRIDDELRSVENPDSSSWKAQDQVLLGWLLSSMSEGIISLVFNLETSLEVWKAIETQFGSQSKSRLLHLRYLMNSTRKDDLKVNEYFIKMKNIADNMAAAGSALSSDDLILDVLSGLGPDYNAVATYITGQISGDKMNLNEAYAMLLTQEARIEQQAHMLSGMDVKHNFEANFAQNRGFKKGNFSGGRGSGNHDYFTGLDNAGNFGNNYRSGYGRSGFFGNGFGNNHSNQFRGFQSDNQKGSGSGNWNNGGGGNNNSIRPQMNPKPQWNASKPTCQICFKTGHTANVCWKLEEFFTSGAYKPPPNRNPKAAYLADMDGAADANWYLDSGATHHLTNDMRNMTMAESFAGNSKLIIGNGTGLHITHVGNAVLRMHNSSAHHTLKLNNMLLVPQISKNLISISQLTKDNNIVIEFTDKSCFVKDKVRNLIILQGKAEKGLYRLLLFPSNKVSSQSCQRSLEATQSKFSDVPLSMFSVVQSVVNNQTSPCLHTAAESCISPNCMLSVSVLHQKLGHPNSKVLSHVINSCSAFKNLNGSNFLDSCDACKMGKMHRLHFPVSTTKTKHVLEVLHTDLWGPAPVLSVQGYRYYVSFVDDFSSPLHKGYKCMHSSGKIFIASHVLFDETSFPYTSNSQFLTSSSKPSDFHYSLLQSYTVSLPNNNQETCEASSAEDEAPSHHFSDHSSPDSHNTTFDVSPSQIHLQPSTIATSQTQQPSSSTIQSTQPSQHPLPNHPMITRAKAGIFKPKAFLTSHNSLEPSTVDEALSDSKWKAAMQLEFDALTRNNTWTLVPMTSQHKLVGCKWVFRTKYNTDGTVSKHKARLVAKGFHQTAGVDYKETFSPVVKSSTVRTILSLAVMKGWKVRQIDINNAFLNGDISEDIYMTQPEGFITKEGYVCKLSKALYGLKQALRAWYDKLKGCLTSWNFFNSKADTSLFIRHDTRGIILVLIYVDDILITGPDSSLLEIFITKFNKVFALKDLGLVSYFLGVEVCYTDSGMHLSQTKYIKDLLSRASMQNCKGSDTPLSTGQKLEKVANGCLGKEFEDPTLYRSIVGGLQYLILTRPDIAYSVHKLSQYLSAPTLQHWLACKKVLRYHQSTVTHGIYIQKEGELEVTGLNGYSDADWACDTDDRKSIGAYCIYLSNNLISRSSKKQAIVAKSSIESEYRALSSASSEISWLESLFSELNIVKLPTPVLWCDNQSAGELAKNPVLHSRSKHIELDIHYIRDKVLQNQLEVRYIPTDEQVADVLTKALSLPKFSYFRSKLNVISRPLSLRGDVKEVKEAHICSQAEDHSSFYNQLQVDDMYCQLAPGGYVAACTHTRDKFVNHLVIS